MRSMASSFQMRSSTACDRMPSPVTQCTEPAPRVFVPDLVVEAVLQASASIAAPVDCAAQSALVEYVTPCVENIGSPPQFPLLMMAQQ